MFFFIFSLWNLMVTSDGGGIKRGGMRSTVVGIDGGKGKVWFNAIIKICSQWHKDHILLTTVCSSIYDSHRDQYQIPQFICCLFKYWLTQETRSDLIREILLFVLFFISGIFLMSFCGLLVVFYLVLCSVTTQSLIGKWCQRLKVKLTKLLHYFWHVCL